MGDQLGKLERIDDLRSVWPNEAIDFTPWLQQNIDLLSAAIGVDIELLEREAGVGSFSADLIGEDPESNRPVIIENQLEQTNHDHLGKLLTYAAGRQGGVIVWIAKEIRLEHRNALDWLNNATAGNIDFFGIEVELLQIGHSAIAPNLKVVVEPKRTNVNSASIRSIQVTPRRESYQSFFQEVLNGIKSKSPRITNINRARPTNSLSIPSGKTGIRYRLAFNSQSRFMVRLDINTRNGPRNKAIFDAIAIHQEAVESTLEATLSWERDYTERRSRVAWFWPQRVTIDDSSDTLRELSSWAIDKCLLLRDAMSGYLSSLPADIETALNEELDGLDTEEPDED